MIADFGAHSPLQFASYRLVLGVYLMFFFARLVPWADELLEGMVPAGGVSFDETSLSRVLASSGDFLPPSVFAVTMAVLAGAFAVGALRRVAALMMCWGLAFAVNRNPLLADPATPFIGWLLLATTLVPIGEPLTATNRTRECRAGWKFPVGLLAAAWIVISVAYSNSGLIKLRAEEWVDGRAFSMFLDSPLHRDALTWSAFRAMPESVLRVITWLGLRAEILCAPLALFRFTRPAAWLSLAGLHVIILATQNTTMLSTGALLSVAFLFDRRWLSVEGLRESMGVGRPVETSRQAERAEP